MKNLLPLILGLACAGCERKASAPASGPGGPPPHATVQTTPASSAPDHDIAGKWSGGWETKTPQVASVKMELTFSPEGRPGQVECRFNLHGNDSRNSRDLKVEAGRVSFRCDLGSDSELRFTGLATGDQIKGDLEILENGEKVAAGTWNVTKATK